MPKFSTKPVFLYNKPKKPPPLKPFFLIQKAFSDQTPILSNESSLSAARSGHYI